MLLIFDVTTGLNNKITKTNVTGQTALIQSLNGLTLSGGEMIFAASAQAFTTVNTASFGRSLLASTSILSLQGTLGLVPGTNVQEYSSFLEEFASSAGSAVNNDIFYYNSGGFSRVTLSTYARDTLLTGTSASNLGFASFSSATDNVIPKWNGTTGALQNTGLTVSDSNDITGVNSINTTVTSAILGYLGDIGSAINSTQWGYLASADQDIDTTADFLANSLEATATLTVGSTSTFGGNINASSNKIINLGAPTNAGDAATKTYVDSVAGSGITPLEAAYAGTTEALSTTYNNTGGTNSRGSLTATSNGAFSVDGLSPIVGQRILVKDQATLLQNGVYVVDVVGDGSNPYVLERSADFEPAVDPISQNTFVLVTNGTINAGTGWLLSQAVTTVGTNDVVFAAFSSQLSAGDGLEQSGGALNVVTVGTTGNIYVNGSNQIDINGRLAIAKGGTNAASYTADRLLAFNSGGTAFETTSLQPSTVSTASNTQTLTNKTLDAATNTVTADALWDKVGSKITIDNTASALNQVLKMTNLTPLEAQWLSESVDINGLTASTSADDADEIVIYDDSLSANRKMTRANFLAGIASPPAGIITVATSGGDYTTITAGLAAASSGDVVLVYPGTYAESVTIPSGVRLVGFPVAQNTTISGADTTSTRVTMSATSTLRNITIVAPSSGSNPAIDCSGLPVANLAVLFEVVILGGGGTGSGIVGAGSGLVAFLNVYHNGGALGASFVALSSGDCIGTNVIPNAGSCTSAFNLSGTINFQLISVIFNKTGFYSCTDMFNVSSTGLVELGSLVVPMNSPATNGIHITADDVDITFPSASLFVTGGFELLVDPALTGADSQIIIDGNVRRENISVPLNYPSNCFTYLVSGLDSGVQNDPAQFIDGELSVGSVRNPSELAVGEGDSTVVDMFVFGFDGSSFIDNTTNAKSRVSGTTFNFFPAITAGNIAYIGNSSRKFFNAKFDIDTAMVIGSGVIVWEYWNGSAWTAFNMMSSLADFPYTQQASNFFTSTASEQIRFNTAIDTDWATTSVNSQLAYWVRVRITTAITTLPVLTRIKLGTNRTELNKDGTIEYFGIAELVRTELLEPRHRSLGTPSNANFDLSASVTNFRNEFSRLTVGEGQSFMIVANLGLDTSRNLEFLVDWIQPGSGTGNITLEATLVQAITPGSNIDSGSLSETSSSQTIAVPGTVGLLQRTTFLFPIANTVANDTLVFQISRSATGDTFGSNIEIFSVMLNTIRWKP